MSGLISFDDLLNRVKEQNEDAIKPGIDFTFEVDKNLVKIKVKDGLKYNQEYQIRVNGLKDIEGNTVSDKPIKTSFRTVMAPYHSSIPYLKDILLDLGQFFKKSEMDSAIRDSSQKAYRYLKLEINPNFKKYKEIEEKHESYTTSRKYVTYFAAYLLISRLLGRLVAGELPPSYIEDEDGNEIEVDPFENYEFKLGDFQVKPANESESKTDPKKKAEAFDILLSKALEMQSYLKREWKYWLDESMNRTARGYTDAIATGIKTNHYIPEDRDF